MYKIVEFLLCFSYVLCDNNQNVIFERRSRNSYFFKLGRNNNEVKLNNRIYFLNHNITDLEYPNGRVANMKKSEEKSNHLVSRITNFFQHRKIESKGKIFST